MLRVCCEIAVHRAAGNARTYRGSMHDDRDLTDEDLRTEIELVSDLVVAARQFDGHLSEEAIDRALGVATSTP
jgi:hypothetical protein